MAAQRDVQSVPIGQFTLPVQGIWQTVASHQLPPEALYDARNVVLRAGVLRPRPALLQFNATVLTAPTGATQYVKADGTKIPLLGTISNIYKFESATWTSIKGATTIGATAAAMTRFTLIEIAGTVYAVMANGVDSPIQWTGTGNAAAVAGTPPIFSDVTTSFDRVVGLVPPYTVRWGETLSVLTWPAVNVKTLAETPDKVVAIRNIGSLGLVVYKERSIWVGWPFGGQSSSAFRFEFVGSYDGPAGPNAIVDFNGIHYYMTVNGRVGSFNGSRHQWVSDGIWPVIKADIDNTYVGRIFGVADLKENEVYFWYPRTGDAGEMKGLVYCNLPYPAAGIQSYASWVGTTIRACGAGCEIRLADNLDKPLVFSTTVADQRSFSLDGGTRLDDAQSFTGYWQTGLVPTPEIEPSRAVIEPFFLRGAGLGSVTLKLVYSEVLNALAGTLSSGATIDLTATPVREPTGFDNRGRFFGARVEFTSDANTKPQYLGANVFVRGLS